MAERPLSRPQKALNGPARGHGRDLTAAEVGEEEDEDHDYYGPLTKVIPDKTLRRAKAVITQWIGITALEPKISQQEVATRVGVSRRTLYRYLAVAGREGWLKYEDPLVRLKHEIAPKVVDNLNYWLDRQDKTVTIETAKGTLFKAYQEAEGISDGAKTVLALKIEMPEGKEAPSITGQVLGIPRGVEDNEKV